VQSAPFEMVEMDQIVSGKRGWVTRGLMEYVGKGDRPWDDIQLFAVRFFYQNRVKPGF